MHCHTLKNDGKGLAQEVRNFVEQTNKRFERTENSNKVLLEAIQKLSSNNNKNERLNS